MAVKNTVLQNAQAGFANLVDGINTFRRSQVIKEAQSEIETINEQFGNEIKDRDQLLEARTQVARQLQLDIQRFGGSAAQAQTAFGALAPSLSAQFQADESEKLQKSGQDFQKDVILPAKKDAAEAVARERVRKEERIAANRKTDKQVAAQKEFRSDPLVRESRKAVRQAETAITMLENAQSNPVVTKAIQTFMARATGEVGNLTEAEREAFGGSGAIAAKLIRMGKIAFKGTLPVQDVNFLRDLAITFRDSARNTIREEAISFGTERAKLLGEDPETIIRSLGVDPGLAKDQKQAPAKGGLRLEDL